MNKIQDFKQPELTIKTPAPDQNLNSKVKSFSRKDSKFVNSRTILEQVRNQSFLWATIEDPNSVDIILQSYGDRQKRLILNCVQKEPLTYSEILKICKISHASLYRKIVALTQAGLLVENFTNKDGTCRKMSKYKTLLEDIQIVIEENRVSIRVKLDKNLTLERLDSLFESKSFLSQATFSSSLF